MPTSKKVTSQCITCNVSFETTIWVHAGIERAAPTLCPACARLKREQESIDQAKRDLQTAILQIQDLWLDECGLEGRWLETRFDTFKRELCPKAFDTVRNFDPDKGKSLLLRSDNYGVGKTHLIAALINLLLETKTPASFRPNSYNIRRHQCPVLFITETSLLTRIRQTFKHSEDTETEEEVYQALRRTPLLIIDDVGKVRPKDYSFLQGVYFQIIDNRYVDESPMILTTNLTLVELEQHIGGASADRLREMCGKDGFISITGKSYRR